MASDIPVVVITGGGSGIGAATARLFAANGWQVAIGDIQDALGEAVATSIAGAVYRHCNVREETDIEALLDTTVAQFGRLDCLFNNAAVGGVMGPIDEIPIPEFDETSEIVLRSVFIGMKHAARIMKPRASGTIVSTASIAGIRGGYGPHAYSAAKAGVIKLTESVALELAEFGIRVNAVAPGNVETPIQTGVWDERWKERMEKVRELQKDVQAFDRMAQPEEIAAGVLWLASEASSYVTGHTLTIDGGLTAGRIWRQQPELMRKYYPPRRME